MSNYPPEVGPLSVYTVKEYYDTMDYAIYGFGNLSRAIGPYSYATEDNSIGPIKICLYQYREGTIFGFNESYIFNPEIDTTCLMMHERDTPGGAQNFLHKHNISIQFSALVRTTMHFNIKTVNLKASGPMSAPDCYKFKVEITFDNADHDGQMILQLDAVPERLVCKGKREICMKLNNQPFSCSRRHTIHPKQ